MTMPPPVATSRAPASQTLNVSSPPYRSGWAPRLLMCPGSGGVTMLGSRGRAGGELLVFDRCEHAQRAVSAAPVVENLEVLEQGVGELDPGSPAAAVEQLGLDSAPEGFDDGVVVAVADRAH